MPESCPPHAEVTVEELDKGTWLVRRHIPSHNVKMVAIPIIKRLPDDPEWDKVEEAFGRHSSRSVPEPEE
jgi:hypothetical protein